MSLHMQARVDKLVLISAVFPGFNTENGLFAKASTESMLAACTKDRTLLIEDFGKSLFADNKPHSFIQWLNHAGMQASPNATVRFLQAMRETDFTAELSKITIPALLLNGTADNILPFDSVVKLQNLITTSSLSVFENSGHALLLEEIEQCNKLLIEFASFSK